jgi:hypothetical protein
MLRIICIADRINGNDCLKVHEENWFRLGPESGL